MWFYQFNFFLLIFSTILEDLVIFEGMVDFLEVLLAVVYVLITDVCQELINILLNFSLSTFLLTILLN